MGRNNTNTVFLLAAFCRHLRASFGVSLNLRVGNSSPRIVSTEMSFSHNVLTCVALIPPCFRSAFDRSNILRLFLRVESCPLVESFPLVEFGALVESCKLVESCALVEFDAPLSHASSSLNAKKVSVHKSSKRKFLCH